MTGMKRTHYCGEVSAADAGHEVVVGGFTNRARDKGELVFIDLRDRTGIVQLVFDDTTDRSVMSKAKEARSEYVLMARGTVRMREAPNPELPTGDVEIYVTELRILAKAQTPPFHITDETDTNEELRLRYRYLDLRRRKLQQNLIKRAKITAVAHEFFANEGFIEIDTPMMIKSTPEGARDYVVPSRVHKGSFYALPKSPQMYKQLLMIAGFDKYDQFARCFRDEDLRADRQPEFTQIDFEMSFVDQEDVMAIGEGFIQEAYKELCGVDIPLPLPRLTWDEAMRRFGSDKPDMRFGLELVDLSDALKNTEFKVFSGALAEGGSVRGICLKGEAEKLSRKEIDKLQEWIKAYGAKGLAWTRLAEKETSSYEKFLSPEECSAIRTTMGAQPGDVLFLVASDDNSVVFSSLGALRCELAKRFGLIDTSKPCLLWVTDFPQFEYSKEEDRYVAMHHPFTAPRDEDVDKLTSDPGHVYAKAYDMVANGYELGGGSIRINDPDVHAKMFEALGFTPEQAQARFGFLLNAFRFGAPPHGGMAWGLERIMMVLLGTDNIRDVLAFPKVASSAELMSAAPGHVDPKQLEELGIAILPSAQKEEA